MSKIAVLGATGHVGQSVSAEFAETGRHEIILVARNLEAAQNVAESNGRHRNLRAVPIEQFDSGEYDVIVNAIGAGDSGRISALGAELMRSTEEWDNRVLAFLEKSPDTLYVCFSSGTAFGLLRDEPVSSQSVASFPINNLSADHCYAVAKLNSETKHRAATGLNIVDLRLFGYASRFIDASSGFFLAQVMAALKNDAVLPTLRSDMTRDYVTPNDVHQLIEKCLDARPLNRAFDVYTKAPVSKFELLRQLKRDFGLVWEELDDPSVARGSVEKDSYYSTDRSAADIGYKPQFSALEGVINEIGKGLGRGGTDQEKPNSNQSVDFEGKNGDA